MEDVENHHDEQQAPSSNGDAASNAQAAQQSAANAAASSFGKLFVGQVPAVCTEEMLTPLFAPYGNLIEIKVMRDSAGRSKGCAWVRYETQTMAQAAIDALHEKHTIPPQTNTLQVRYANATRDRSDRRPMGGPRQDHGPPGADRLGGGDGVGGLGGNPFYPMPGGGGQGGSGGGLGAFGSVQQPSRSPWGVVVPNEQQQQQPVVYFSQNQGHNSQGGQQQGGYQMEWPPLYGNGGGGGGMQQRMPKSPPGISVFVGNLPPSISVPELRQAFQQHLGPNIVMQVNIHKDKRFGFVTFETPQIAAEASSQLNGMTIYDRRLRVEVTQNEPRLRPAGAGQPLIAQMTPGGGMGRVGMSAFAGH